ncbi:MAG: hypothetical protein ACRDYW_08855 [Acidimicrobiales bacterium]
MAQRVLAVLGAVVIVLVAVVVRSAIDDDDDGSDPSGDGDGGGGELVLACDTDLEAYCRAVTGTSGLFVEESATTSLGVIDGALNEVDAWVTSDAWFEVTQARADVIGAAEVLASSPVVAAVDPDRATAVSGLCGDQAIWRCLGDRAGEPWASLGGQPTWGPLDTGLPDADRSTGLSILASVASAYFGDQDFAANEFDDAFTSWLDRLTAPAPRGDPDPDPANTLVVRRGTYTAAGTVEARLTAITRPVDRLVVEPGASARVVLVDLPGGDDVADVTRQLRELLTTAGWAPGSGEPAPTLKPGVMAALHTLWTEVTR